MIRRTLAVALLPALLGGCATRSGTNPAERAELRWRAEIRRLGVAPEGLRDPLASTAEMRRVARDVAGGGSDLDRLRRLQRHLFDADRFTFDSGSRGTRTAIEAFELRTGNCVSFTNLFLALARSLDIRVRAALLALPGNVERRENLIVVNNHIVAVHEHGGGATVFDFNRSRERPRVGLRMLDEPEVTGLYLNNLGVESLLAGDLDTAGDRLRRAVRLAPEFAPAYGNLGVVLRRRGDRAGARDAYRRALERDPANPTVLRNLAALYESEGREAAARAALRAADLRGATPYTLVIRGDLERIDGRPRRARALYRRAARLGRRLPEPWLALARLELEQGRPRAAADALDRAAVRSANPADLERLRSRLGEPRG